MPEPAQKYELSFLRACRKADISWDGRQCLCISLCRRLLKSSSYPFSEHAERSILGETVCKSMHQLMPETAQSYQLSFLRACRKVDISWDCLQFLCISLCQRLLESMSYPFWEHAERWILVETIFNFFALACSRDCSQAWAILPQSMQTGWY